MIIYDLDDASKVERYCASCLDKEKKEKTRKKRPHQKRFNCVCKHPTNKALGYNTVGNNKKRIITTFLNFHGL